MPRNRPVLPTRIRVLLDRWRAAIRIHGATTTLVSGLAVLGAGALILVAHGPASAAQSYSSSSQVGVGISPQPSPSAARASAAFRLSRHRRADQTGPRETDPAYSPGLTAPARHLRWRARVPASPTAPTPSLTPARRPTPRPTSSVPPPPPPSPWPMPTPSPD